MKVILMTTPSVFSDESSQPLTYVAVVAIAIVSVAVTTLAILYCCYKLKTNDQNATTFWKKYKSLSLVSKYSHISMHTNDQNCFSLSSGIQTLLSACRSSGVLKMKAITLA